MPRFIPSLATCLATAALVLPFQAQAKDDTLACSVAVDYMLNNAVVESYSKSFTVSPGVAFADNFSTPIRQKQFNASLAREAGRLVVSIDYFNDVGVFVAIGFNTRLAMRDGQGIETTAGSNSFATSIGAAGNHVTNYTLSCRRA